MQIEPRVKWFDSDWSGQIVFLLLFGNKGKSLSLSKWITNAHKVRLRGGIGAEGFGTAVGRQKRRPGRERGRRRWWGIKDCAGICQKPIIILVQKRSTISGREINITLLWVWEYIQDSSNWLFLMLQWQFHLQGPSTTTTVQLPGLSANWKREEKKIQIPQDKWMFIWLK